MASLLLHGKSLIHAMSFFTIIILSLLSLPAAASPESDALLKLKASFTDTRALASWTENTAPCTGNTPNWPGLRCANNSVWVLQLQNMGLSGMIDVGALAGLPLLRTMSFMYNNFSGPMPDFGKLVDLRAIFLSRNQFSGEIPAEAFASMVNLKKVYLSENRFSGKIPESLTGLTKLLELGLEKNEFSGRIPDFKQTGLVKVDFSYNNLTGPIPSGLKKMSNSSFLGNKDLCGEPLTTKCKPSSPGTQAIALIVISIGLAFFAAAAIFVYFRRHRTPEPPEGSQHSSTKSKKVASCEGNIPESVSPAIFYNMSLKKDEEEEEKEEMVIVTEDKEKFELQDLLTSSAEGLGVGSFGSSYKVVSSSGPTLVVKRFKGMNNVSRDDFHEHMTKLGGLRHPNLLPILAFYYGKEEKLIVTDYLPNGSLFYLLHGNKSPNRPILDWPTRLRIVEGVARGLLYLYDEFPNLNLPHGNLKSANILLTTSLKPLLTDYTLAPLINPEDATQPMVGYTSPEYLRFNQTTKKSDVWSLGILILEVLTGKLPSSYPQQESSGSDLANWVKSVVREEWTSEVVFDAKMGGTKNCEGLMLKLLKIGLGCCEADVEMRCELEEVVMRIEELRDWGSEDEGFTSFASEGEVLSSKGEANDEVSFSMN